MYIGAKDSVGQKAGVYRCKKNDDIGTKYRCIQRKIYLCISGPKDMHRGKGQGHLGRCISGQKIGSYMVKRYAYSAHRDKL